MIAKPTYPSLNICSPIRNVSNSRHAWKLCGLIVVMAMLFARTASAAIGIDVTTSTDRSTKSKTIASSTFSTASGNELLLAFISADYASGSGTTVTQITGGGLTWALVVRTNGQSGDAEIWRAFAPSTVSSATVTATLSQSVAASMTVVSFTGVNTSGTNGSGAVGATGSANAKSGAPTATLITTQANSWVFGVGDDYDNAISRTLGPTQTLVHQYLATVGDTYWVQRQTNPTALSGTSVTINDTAPTGDRYNLSIVEVLAASSGGTGPASITAVAGTTPQSAMIGTAFGTALQATVKDGSNNPVTGATVTFTAPASGTSGTFAGGVNTATTNASGIAIAAAFTANTTAGGPYTVTATVSGVATPANFSLTNTPGPAASVTATAGASQSAAVGATFSTALQATVKDASNNAVSGVTVTFTAPSSGASGTFAGGVNTATTNSSGVATAVAFTANSTVGGPYIVTASVSGVASPANYSLTNTAVPPASITAGTGTTPQSAMIGSAFTTALQATVKDAIGNPVSGVTVTFTAPGSGASGTFAGGVNTATTDTNGLATAPTFTANTTAGGPYTVTASVSGVSTPANFSLTNTAGPASTVTATAGASQSANVGTAFAIALQATVKDASSNPVSGVTVTFTAPGSGASGTFAGGVNTATTNSSGVATAAAFIANSTVGGPYTVTANVSGVSTPANFSLTNTAVPVGLALDATASGDSSAAKTTIATPAFSTTASNELLLAFISTDKVSSPNTTVTGVAGGGLTWVLVYRTNVQSGDAEIWRAFTPSTLSGATVTATLSQGVAASITVVSFTGADTTGTNGSGAIGATGSGNSAKGAPTASLVTTRNSSWVFGVGNDYDNGIVRTLGANQTMVHQYLATVGDTYWVQRLTNPTSASGTTVTVNDTAPTTDHFNLSIVEVLPASGGVTPTPDLTITKSHSSSFAQGQTGANYTITVTNSGSAATSGTVTMTDTLPAGLTATAISGTNWNCTLSTLTCTRSDALAVGVSYPAITLTVNVAANAPASVTNTAKVSGGGETNTSNDTATDPTTITVLGAITHVGGAGVHAIVNNQVMTLNYTPVGANNAVVVMVGCISQGITGISLAAPGWTFAPISGLVGPSGNFDYVSTFGAIVPSTTPVTFTVTLTGVSGTCTNDGSILVDEFSGTDTTGGTTTFDAHNQSLSPLQDGGICTEAPVTPANNNDAIWYACYDNVTGVSGGYTAGQQDGIGDWTEYQVLTGGMGVAQNASFTINPNYSTFTLAGVSIKPAATVVPPTYSLSGTITPAASGSGSTVTLTGTSVGTLTTSADSNGDFMFTGLANGTYTVTPTKTGLTFTPPNQNVPVNGANVTGIAFTAQTSGSNPIKLVQSNVNGNESGTANMSVSFQSNNTAGNFLIVTGTAARPATTLTVSDSQSNVYTPAFGPVTDTVQNVTVYIWYVPSCKGGANTVTITPSGTAALEIHVSEWSGIATSSPVDKIASATGTGTSVSSGAMTTTTNGELIFGYGWVFNTASAGAGFTPISLVNGDLDEYQIQQTAGSIAATFTQSSGTWFAALATFKPASGGTSGGTGPTVSMTSPAANTTATSLTNVSASATDQTSSLMGVQFLLDGSNLGAEVTSAPYSMTWDTTTTTAGVHSLSAIAYDSAGMNGTAAPITITVDNSGNPALVGSWSSAVSIPAVAVNLILLRNGNLLFYQDGSTPTVWNYTANTFTNVATTVDLFCSGQTALSDGRILIVGGYGGSGTKIGIPNAEIFDPSNNSWTKLPNMAYSRWYPDVTALSDGTAIVLAGWQTTNHSNAGIPEIYNPTTNKWTSLTTANNPFETYPFMFMLSDGRLIHVGGSEYATDTETLNLTTQTWTVMDARILDGGSASMYSPGKIVKAGSAADSQTVGASSNTTFVLDTTQPSPEWQQTPSMAYPRSFLNLTELPDGTVLATGGETDKNGGDIANAVYAAELWSPQTMTWTTMSSMHTPREYHGTALLLPDGRVVESGMGADFGNVPDEESAEFYSPPYLFKGARPTITQAPAQVTYGQSFFISTPDGATITSAVMIRTGAPTHFFDQSTHFVPVSFQQTTEGLNITAPATATLAPPGYYMLFILNSNGVPSIAPFVQLQ